MNDADLADQWRAAAADERILSEVLEVYDAVAGEVEARGPACWASGRCCHFEATGHRLYVTGLEAAVAQRLSQRTKRGPATAHGVQVALSVGGCPFQTGHLCGLRDGRPLSCRTYFCDRSAQQWQHQLTELGVGRLREIHQRFEVPYRYAEWRSLLALLAEDA